MRKRVLRIVSLLLVALLLVSLVPNATVSAAESITVTAEPSWPCGELNYGVYDSLPGYALNMVFNKGNYWVTEFSYFNLSDGRIGYCIQPYKPGTTGSYTQNPSKWADLSDQRQQGVGLAFLYGAPNNGDTSSAAYFATAAVVRDMACGYRMGDTTFTTNGNNGSVFTSSPFGEKLRTGYPEAYAKYEEILAAIAKHGTLPSFAVKSKYEIGAAQTLTLKYNKTTGLYEASATDTNGVLAHFNYTSSIAGLTITKSGNTLSFSATAEAAAKLAEGVTMSGRGFEFEQPQDVCTVWSAGDASQLIAVMDAATDPVPSYFKLQAENPTGKLQIKKTAPNGGSVAGWSFTIQDAAGKTVGTYVSDASGVITADLAPGTYTVTETDGEYEYWQNDPEPTKTVTVVAGQTATVTFENRLMGKIKIIKTVVGEGSVEGWQFRITRLSDNKDMGTFTSGADGTILTGKLEPVSYRVEELLPDGSLYQCTTENPQTVTVVAGQTATVTFSNSLRPGKIAIEKVDAQGNPLAGAKFLLEWSKDGGTWAAVTGTPAGEVVTGGCASAGLSDGCLTSGSDGLVVFEGLHPGLYYRLTEVEAPAGYTLLTDTAFEGQLPLDTLTVTLKVVNSPRIVMPMTGAFGPILAAVGAAVTIVCACCLLSRRRRNKK